MTHLPPSNDASTANSRARRTLGAVVGAIMGLGYAWVANSINVWVMDIPIRLDATAMLNAMLSYGVGGAVVGLVTAWPHSKWYGVLVGAAATVLLSVGLSAMQAASMGAQGVATFVILVAFFFPAVVFSSPISIALRYVINRLSEALLHTTQVQWRPLGLGLVTLVVLVGLAGTLAQYSQPEKDMLRRVNNMVQFALAQTHEPLVAAWRNIENLRPRLTPNYTMSARTFTSEGGGAFSAQAYVEVLVAFDSGLRVLCVSGESLGDMLCTEPLPGQYGP